MSRLAVLALALAAHAACAQQNAPAPAAPVEPPPVSNAPRIPGAVGDVLVAYDQMRLQLAHDDVGAVKTAAALAEAAKKSPALATLAGHADLMSKADDLVKARNAFGDVSKDVVALIAADPALQVGRFLFLCPMAHGYQKWVQTTAKLENPFFGKQMLDCGEQLKTWSV